jgi:hypothetical protein
MLSEQSDGPEPARIGERLAAARRSRFVGRRAELDRFGSAMLAAEPPFVVLYIHGNGGVGKTALLHEYARLAAASSRPVVALDGHHLVPSPPEVLRALRHQLGAQSSDLTAILRAWPERAVLLIDTYEALAPLDTWLRETFLPQLPAHTLIVIAGRTPPAPAWRVDLAWAELTATLALGNLGPAECQAFLAERAIPSQLHADVLAFTHGHPLALALVADVLRQGPMPAVFRPEAAPDVVRVLLERLVHDIPSPAHRQALDVCVLTWATTEALLADVLDDGDVPVLFAWLRGLSFIAQGPYGLFPHDLVREVLAADLRWRNPAGHQQLVRRLIAHLAARLGRARGVEQQRLWFDLLALTRHHPFFQSYFDWDALGTAYAEAAAPEDHGALLELVARHEGEEAAQIARYWLGRQPAAFVVFRAFDGALLGCMGLLALQQPLPKDLAADPAIAAAWAFVDRQAPLRAGEDLLYLRFWMGDQTYQGVSPALNLAAIHSSIAWTSHPRPGWSLVATADPAFHAGHFASIHFQRAPEAEFVVAGHRYGVFAHDWRVEPAAEWLESKVDLAAPGVVVPLRPPVAPGPPRVVLSREAFDEAVRQALRDYTSLERLAANPLLQTRLAAPPASTPASPALVQALLREALASLQASPRDLKFHRALWHTYIVPAPTQEQAAELLGLPFNTYRYQLAQGIARVSEWLWQRELGGAGRNAGPELAPGT